MTEVSADRKDDGFVAGGRAWITLVLCCLLYVFSFVDRLILSLLVTDIGRDLAVTDVELGLLIGVSFSIAYSVAGVPIAHYLDRGSRKWIMVAGVLLWGAMTMLSSLAQSFALLAFCRAGVALGEAVLTPGVISLISDLFPRHRRTVPTSLYASIAAFMAIGGFVLSAAALELARQLEPSLRIDAWRLALVFAGLPSVLLGTVFAFIVREPRRGAFDPGDAKPDQAGMGTFLRHLQSYRAFYLPLLMGTGTLSIFLFGVIAWTPTLLVRAYGFNSSGSGVAFGMVGAVAGLLGSAFWPTMVSLMKRRDIRDPIPLSLTAGALLSLSFGIAAPLMPTSTAFLALLALSLFSGTSSSMLLPLAIQSYTPSTMRASGMASVMLAQNLVGYGIGPLMVAFIAEWWQAPTASIGYAIAVTAAIAFPVAVCCYFLAWRSNAAERMATAY